MEEPLIIIFTLVNDRTRTYLQGLHLAEDFNEDQDLAVIRFNQPQSISISESAPTGDIVLLYDGNISRKSALLLQQLAGSRPVYVVFHSGLDGEEDLQRRERQQKKLSELCPQLQPSFLQEHSSCGFVFDTLIMIAHCIQNRDAECYALCLQKLLHRFIGEPLPETWLPVLHLCQTPQGARQMLENMGRLPIHNHPTALSLAQRLAAGSSLPTAEYLQTLTELRDLLLPDETP